MQAPWQASPSPDRAAGELTEPGRCRRPTSVAGGSDEASAPEHPPRLRRPISCGPRTWTPLDFGLAARTQRLLPGNSGIICMSSITRAVGLAPGWLFGVFRNSPIRRSTVFVSAAAISVVAGPFLAHRRRLVVRIWPTPLSRALNLTVQFQERHRDPPSPSPCAPRR